MFKRFLVIPSIAALSYAAMTFKDDFTCNSSSADCDSLQKPDILNSWIQVYQY